MRPCRGMDILRLVKPREDRGGIHQLSACWVRVYLLDWVRRGPSRDIRPKCLQFSACPLRVKDSDEPCEESLTTSSLSVRDRAFFAAVAVWKVGGGDSGFGSALTCSYGTTTRSATVENSSRMDSQVYLVGSAGAGAGSPAPAGPHIFKSARLHLSVIPG